MFVFEGIVPGKGVSFLPGVRCEVWEGFLIVRFAGSFCSWIWVIAGRPFVGRRSGAWLPDLRQGHCSCLCCEGLFKAWKSGFRAGKDFPGAGLCGPGTPRNILCLIVNYLHNIPESLFGININYGGKEL